MRICECQSVLKSFYYDAKAITSNLFITPPIRFMFEKFIPIPDL